MDTRNRAYLVVAVAALVACEGPSTDALPGSDAGAPDTRLDLSACGQAAYERWLGTPYVVLHRWKNDDRQDHFVTTEPAWHGCGGMTPDIRRIADGLSDDAYGYDKTLGVVFRPELPPPPGTVPLYSYRKLPGAMDPITAFDLLTTTDTTQDWAAAGYELRRLEGHVYPASWRPDMGLIAMSFATFTTWGEEVLSVPGDPMTYSVDGPAGYVLDPATADFLRHGECFEHSDCASSHQCVFDSASPIGPSGARGRCLRRCFTNRDCSSGEAPRCDIQIQRCVAPLVRFDDPSAVTFERATEGSYLDGPLRLRWAGTDTLRWEDRGDGHGPQPLLEGASTNLVLASHDPAGSSWVDTDLSLVGRVRAPDGSRSGALLRADALAGRRETSVSVATSEQYTLSGWARHGRTLPPPSHVPELKSWENMGAVVTDAEWAAVDAIEIEDDVTWNVGVGDYATTTGSTTYVASAWILKDSDTTRFPAIYVVHENFVDGILVQLDTSTGDTDVLYDSGFDDVAEGTIDVPGWWVLWIRFTTVGPSANVMLALDPAVGSTFGSTDPEAMGSIVARGARLDRRHEATGGAVTLAGLRPVFPFPADLTWDWRRGDFVLEATTTGSADIGFTILGTGQELSLFGLQVEEGRLFPSSYIRTVGTSATRAADSLTTASLPSIMTSGAFSIDVWPAFASHELASGEVLAVIRKSGAAPGVYFMALSGVTYLYLVDDTDLQVFAPVEFERHQRLRIHVDIDAALLEVRGASNDDPIVATGDVGPFSWTASGPWYFGGADDTPFFGRMSEPYLTIGDVCATDVDCTPDHRCSSDLRCFPSCTETMSCPGGRVCGGSNGKCNLP